MDYNYLTLFLYILVVFINVASVTMYFLAKWKKPSLKNKEFSLFFFSLIMINLFYLVLYFLGIAVHTWYVANFTPLDNSVCAFFLYSWFRFEKTYASGRKTLIFYDITAAYLVFYIAFWGFMALFYYFDKPGALYPAQWAADIIYTLTLAAGCVIFLVSLKNKDRYMFFNALFISLLMIYWEYQYEGYYLARAGFIKENHVLNSLTLEIFMWIGIDVTMMLIIYRMQFCKAFGKLTDKISYASYDIDRQLSNMQAAFSLTARETEILKLLEEGKSNREIEETLFISSNTVKVHIYRIYKKLGTKNRIETVNALHKI